MYRKIARVRVYIYRLCIMYARVYIFCTYVRACCIVYVLHPCTHALLLHVLLYLCTHYHILARCQDQTISEAFIEIGD